MSAAEDQPDLLAVVADMSRCPHGVDFDVDECDECFRPVSQGTEDSPDVRERDAQDLWRCDNGNLYRWSDQGVWEGMPFSGGPWWQSSWDSPEAMAKAGLRLTAVPDALSWHVGQEVEWNPTEDNWRPGVIVDLKDGLAAVVLHGNGQRLNIEIRHLRSTTAVSPLVEQLRQARAAYNRMAGHAVDRAAERDRYYLAWQSAARGRRQARVERDTARNQFLDHYNGTAGQLDRIRELQDALRERTGQRDEARAERELARESRDQYHKNWDAAVAANMTALDTIGELRADLETRTCERDAHVQVLNDVLSNLHAALGQPGDASLATFPDALEQITHLRDAVAEYDRHAPACLRERDQLRVDLMTRTRERDHYRDQSEQRAADVRTLLWLHAEAVWLWQRAEADETRAHRALAAVGRAIECFLGVEYGTPVESARALVERCVDAERALDGIRAERDEWWRHFLGRQRGYSDALRGMARRATALRRDRDQVHNQLALLGQLSAERESRFRWAEEAAEHEQGEREMANHVSALDDECADLRARLARAEEFYTDVRDLQVAAAVRGHAYHAQAQKAKGVERLARLNQGYEAFDFNVLLKQVLLRWADVAPVELTDDEAREALEDARGVATQPAESETPDEHVREHDDAAPNRDKVVEAWADTWDGVDRTSEWVRVVEPCPVPDCTIPQVHGHEGYGLRFTPAAKPAPQGEPDEDWCGRFADDGKHYCPEGHNTVYQMFSGGREWYCADCGTQGTYPPAPADVGPRARLLTQPGGAAELKRQMDEHLASPGTGTEAGE